MVAAKKVTKKPSNAKFTIDCAIPTKDGLMTVTELRTYMEEHMKVDGKTGNFVKKNKVTGESITRVTLTEVEDKLIVDVQLPCKKRYLKYLAKRFLCKCQLRDFIRVVAMTKDSYTLRYFSAIKKGVKA